MFRALFILLFAVTTAFGGEINGGLSHGDYSVSVGKKNQRYVSDHYGYVQRQDYWESFESDGKGYVYMDHMQKYEIRLNSMFPGRTDAKVVIDGKEIGTFRVEANSKITLERSANDTGRFTFIKNRTDEFYEMDLDRVSRENFGLISVTFYPEIRGYRYGEIEVPSYRGRKTSYAGGTALSGTSGQRFVDADRVPLDYNRAVTIHLRLVGKPEKVQSPSRLLRPLNGVYEPRRRIETIIPAPVLVESPRR